MVDENTTDLRSLNDLLNDPSSSSELRAIAVDLQRAASRATKIERQARTQQVHRCIESVFKSYSAPLKDAVVKQTHAYYCVYYYFFGGMWWLIGRVDAFRPQGRGFESRSSRQVGTLGKSSL